MSPASAVDDLEVVWSGTDDSLATLATRRPAPGSVRPADEATVKARDAAILARLTIAPARLPGLVAVLPEEPGLSEADRQVACQSALIRLRVKSLVRSDGELWALA